MRQIKLQSLSLLNFKGIESLDVTFQDETVIRGENGTGKTTLFDAFTWCLFGKDSTGRSDSNFNICPIGADGKVVLKREPAVTCVLTVDGSTIKFSRVYREVWTKPRGTSEETLTSHKTEFYVNDVKQSTKKDYDAEVAAVLPEDVFRMVTNPFYFTSLKAEEQKNMLLQMAGDVTDSEVAALNPEFVVLLANLEGRPMVTFLKEIAAKKRAIKDELETIPSQVETAQRLMSEELNWKALEKELKEKKSKVAEIDAQLADVSQAVAAESQRKVAIQKEIGAKRMELAKREQELRTEAMGSVNAAQRQISELEMNIQRVRNQHGILANDIRRDQEQLVDMDKRLTVLRNDFRAINASQLEFPEGAFVCPTCKRPLEQEDIEAKQQELEANFLRAKSAKLEANKKSGVELAGRKVDLVKTIEEKEAKLAALAKDIEQGEAERDSLKTETPQAPNVEDLLRQDSQSIALRNEVAELENQLSMVPTNTDNSELVSGKAILNSAIEELVRQLSTRDQRARAEAEVARLEERRVAANQELADLEGVEFVATNFQKTKDSVLQQRINGLFKLVAFSFVDEQMNGGEKLTCICTVNGTPYPDVNNAGKINAGLDIINAICASKGITAPIFIDNRESVNFLIPTLSQVVNLVVSQDKRLSTVKDGGIVEL